MKDLIRQAAKNTGFVRTYSCCSTDDKYCESDEWRGNLEGFAEQLVILHALQKEISQEEET